MFIFPITKNSNEEKKSFKLEKKFYFRLFQIGNFPNWFPFISTKKKKQQHHHRKKNNHNTILKTREKKCLAQIKNRYEVKFSKYQK